MFNAILPSLQADQLCVRNDNLAFIDGLRGFAILSVLGYHAMPSFVPSGYAGVDVFFVISGFVITRLIHREIGDGRFSLLAFLARRARRLLPAAFVVYVATVAIGYYLLLPDAFTSFGRSLTGASLLYANMVFYRMIDYFAQSASESLLLHTWSLSVEEQFYLIFPPLLTVLVPRVSQRWLAAVLVISSIVCFGYAQWAATRDVNFAFYALQARAWEFLIGAGLAAAADWLQVSQRVAQIISTIGFCLLAGSAFIGTSVSTGLAAPVLMGCSGAVLVIGACLAHRTVIARIFASPAPVFLGLISYSLYLWHWPLLAAAHSLLDGPPQGLMALAVVFATLLLAVFSWRFIEQPFRARVTAPAPTLLVSTVVMGLLAATGAALVKTQGYPARLDNVALEIYTQKVTQNSRRKKCDGVKNAFTEEAFCTIGRVKEPAESFDVAVMGDSNADHLVPGIDLLLKRHNLSGRQITQNHCAPVFGLFEIYGRNKNKGHLCDDHQRAMMRFVHENPALKLVVLGAYWPSAGARLTDSDFHDNGVRAAAEGTSRDFNFFEDRLRATVEFFSNRGINVLLVGRIPTMAAEFPLRCAVAARRGGRGGEECGVPTSDALLAIEPSETILTRIAADTPNVALVSTAKILCKPEMCSTMNKGNLFYFDRSHLNVLGSEYLSRFITLPGRPGP